MIAAFLSYACYFIIMMKMTWLSAYEANNPSFTQLHTRIHGLYPYLLLNVNDSGLTIKGDTHGCKWWLNFIVQFQTLLLNLYLHLEKLHVKPQILVTKRKKKSSERLVFYEIPAVLLYLFVSIPLFMNPYFFRHEIMVVNLLVIAAARQGVIYYLPVCRHSLLLLWVWKGLFMSTIKATQLTISQNLKMM